MVIEARIVNRCPGGGMVDAGDLKSPDQESCRFESCPGHHLVLENRVTEHIAMNLQIQFSGPNDRADLIGVEQLFECLSVEQRRALIPEAR